MIFDLWDSLKPKIEIPSGDKVHSPAYSGLKKENVGKFQILRFKSKLLKFSKNKKNFCLIKLYIDGFNISNTLKKISISEIRKNFKSNQI